jgi:hypothetical protein
LFPNGEWGCGKQRGIQLGRQDPGLRRLGRKVILWNAATGEIRVTLYSLESGKASLAVTPDGYYAGSKNVNACIRWRVCNTLYPARKYAAKYHRPDLVTAALGRR